MTASTITPQALVSNVEDLISLPEVYFGIRNVINDPTSSFAEVAEVVSQDPNIAARILRITNSSFFGFATEIETVTRAITIMGLSQLNDLVLATTVVHAFKGVPNDLIDMKHFWIRSVFCGSVARLLASCCNVLDSERLFVSGILHDLGHLLIYSKLPVEAASILTRAKQEHKNVVQLEREILGWDYALVSGELLQAWKLPASHIETVACHTDLGRAGEFRLDAAIVHIASVMAAREFQARYGFPGLSEFDPAAWQETGLVEEDLGPVRREAEKNMAEVLKLLFAKAS